MKASLCALVATLAILSAPAMANEKIQTFGPNPILPPPDTSLIPTVNIAKAVGWPKGKTPLAAEGFKVNNFAGKLDHPRWVYVLPNGDVLVAESNKPSKKPEGVKAWVQGKVMKRAGAGVESANRITLLRDTDKDGVADLRTAFLRDLHSPFGMALIGKDFYVANTDAIVKFPYVEGETAISAKPVKVADLPANPPNSHWTKSLIASADGKKLYVGVGANSNIAENGMEAEKNRAAILEVDIGSGQSRVYASGLRNPVGTGWNPVTGELWTAVNERDELGTDLVPDYMTSVKDGGFYGWPYSYFGQIVDERVEPQNPELVKTALRPDYALGAHTASLGLTFYDGEMFPERYKNGVFIGQHGSWNRKPLSGYKLLFIPFKDGKPDGMPEDILTGFVTEQQEAWGRPVGVAVAKDGAVLMADDVGNIIWRVSKK